VVVDGRRLTCEVPDCDELAFVREARLAARAAPGASAMPE
jgi:hypothetical protein